MEFALKNATLSIIPGSLVGIFNETNIMPAKIILYVNSYICTYFWGKMEFTWDWVLNDKFEFTFTR